MKGFLAVAEFEFVDGLEHLPLIDLMDFESLADAAEKGDRQFTAKVLAEFFQAGEEDGAIVRIDMEEFAGKEIETEEFEEGEDAALAFAVEVIHSAGVNDVEGNADGNGFSVAKAVLGELLEFVSSPVAEIQRTRGTEFERITGSGDVIGMEFGGTEDEALHGFRIELAEAKGVPLEGGEEVFIADECNFDGFHVAGPLVALGQGFEKFEVVDDSEGRREGADEILFAEGVDAVFYADAGIILAQGGGGDANVPHAAMRGGRREANHIEERTAADGDDEGMAVDMETIDLGVNFGDVKVGVFGAFSAFENDGRTNQAQAFVGAEISLDIAGEERLGLGEGFIDENESFSFFAIVAVGHDIVKNAVSGMEHALGEMHLVAVAHLNHPLDTGHNSLICSLRRKSRVVY